MAGPLKNPRHEKYSVMVADGIKPVDAYLSMGYSKNGASQSASALLKRPTISSRIREIQEASAKTTISNAVFDRERVLNRLNVLSQKAEEAGQISAAIRAEELIGKERGMFIDRAIQTVWSGDVATLNASQLAQFKATLEAVAAEQAAAPAEPEPPTVQ